MKGIVTFFKQWTTASDNLHAEQFEEDFEYRLIQETRNAPVMLTQEEVVQVEDVAKLLRPVAELTAEFSGTIYVTNSKVIPAVCLLRENIAGKELDKQFNKWDENPLLTIATLLDTRFKRMYFPAALTCSKVLKLVENQISISLDSGAGVTEEPIVDNFWRSHCERLKRQKKYESEASFGKLHLDLQQYIHKENSQLHEDPMKYWCDQRFNYPRLAEVAIKYLSTVATSVPCERLFSRASSVATVLRNRLSTEHITMQVLLKSLDYHDWYG
ncbi:zinc finger BED domain-containing protein 1-like [Diachasma alloeum]|uniref:zinc finger BED domain-containing protein 1-like n=1 Tax=Diachasma alloeum TaxID=454923 RepID=UPI0007383BCF|nr:zinc finger BED domain-containing protein 1-like [Diachasma alloeum]